MIIVIMMMMIVYSHWCTIRYNLLVNTDTSQSVLGCSLPHNHICLVSCCLMIENICICIYLPHDHNYKNLQKTQEEMVRRPKGIYKAYVNYRIYSINRPGRLLNFWTLRVGAYSRLGAY